MRALVIDLVRHSALRGVPDPEPEADELLIVEWLTSADTFYNPLASCGGFRRTKKRVLRLAQ